MQQTGRALYEAGILRRFLTTLVDRPDAHWRRWTAHSGWLDQTLRRRDINGFPRSLAVEYPRREFLRLLVRQLDRGGVWTDRLWEWAEQGFDAWVARHGLEDAPAVYAYEHAALLTFEAARVRGMRCIYDVPAPEHEFAQRVRDEEIAAHPELDSPYQRHVRRHHARRTTRRRMEWQAADLVIANSEFTRSTYAAAGLDVSKVRVVAPGAPPVAAGGGERESASGALRFLFVGSVALHKGAHHLLEAWRRLRVPPGEGTLEFIGGMALPPAAWRGCPETVRFAGWRRPEEVFEAYRRADALVFPTLCDGFGMVVTEAFSQGVPVITTPRAGAAGLLREKVNGLVVPAADPGALAGALDWCLTHRRELRGGMREAARATAAGWQWSDNPPRIVEVLAPGSETAGKNEEPLAGSVLVPAAVQPSRSPRARVCLVTSGNVASNPRLVKEAHALRAAGYPLRIVAADTMPSLSPYDAAIFEALDCEYIRVSARLPRWRHAGRAALQRAARWALGTPAGKSVRLASWAHHQLSHALGAAAARGPADLYLAHNLAALPAAATAARRHRAAFGFDAEDFHCGELEDTPDNARELAARTAVERALLPRCAHLTAAAPEIARCYADRYGIRMQAILNVFPLDDAPVAPVAPEGGPSLYWFSQTVGPQRGLEEVVRAMGRMDTPVRLRLRGNPSSDYPDALRTLARQVGGDDLARRIDFLPVAPPAEMARLAAVHDVGLALEQNRPLNRALCLTNKIFVYLLAGLPICLSRTPAQEAIAADLGDAAWIVDTDDPEAFARSLDERLGDPSRLQNARIVAWHLAQTRYNWNVEQCRLLATIERSLQAVVR